MKTVPRESFGVNRALLAARKQVKDALHAWLLREPDLIPAGFEALKIIDEGRIFEVTEHPGTFQVRIDEKLALLVLKNRCYCDPERQFPVCAHRIARSLVLRTQALERLFEKTLPTQTELATRRK